jgi:hypothetical protein
VVVVTEVRLELPQQTEQQTLVVAVAVEPVAPAP